MGLLNIFGFGSKEPVEETKLTEAAGGDIDNIEEEGFRPITSDANRNLTPITQARMRKVAAKLWESNLLANRLVELPLAYLLAEGMSLTHDEPEYQDQLNAFWHHPINNMDEKLEKRVRELGLFGELFLMAFVSDAGDVRLGYLDVEQVKDIVFDPDNPEQPIGLITQRDKSGKYRKYKIIINGGEDDCFTDRTIDIREGFDDGQVFYFNINSLGSHARGRSDLLAQADYLDIYDHLLYGEADRIDFLRAFVWHFQIEGATSEEIDAKWKKVFGKPPAPSSTLVTNEKVTMKPQSPQINASDTTESVRMFKNHNLGGATIPEHIFGGGGDVNRSTGDSMMEPFEKVLTMRQTTIKNMLRTIGIFQLRMKLMRSGGKEPELNHAIYDLKVNTPEMTAKDTAKYATALQQVVTACTIAIQSKVMTKETAVRMIDAIAGRLGVDIDAKAELKNAEKAKDKSSEEDVYTESDENEVA